MQEQGPKTPSPTPEVSAGEEKNFSSENENPRPDLADRDSKSLESCRLRFPNNDLGPLPAVTRGFQGYPGTHYNNRSGLRDKEGTQDPHPPVGELFPLNANFQKP